MAVRAYKPINTSTNWRDPNKQSFHTDPSKLEPLPRLHRPVKRMSPTIGSKTQKRKEGRRAHQPHKR